MEAVDQEYGEDQTAAKVGTVGQGADGVRRQDEQERGAKQEVHQKQDEIGGQVASFRRAVDGLQLQGRVRLDGEGVRPLVVEDLHLGGGAGQLPAGPLTEVLEGQLAPGGAGIEVRGVGEVGHVEGQPLRLDPPVDPAEFPHPLQEPAPGRHGLQVPFDVGPVIEGEDLQPPLGIFHVASSSPNTRR